MPKSGTREASPGTSGGSILTHVDYDRSGNWAGALRLKTVPVTPLRKEVVPVHAQVGGIYYHGDDPAEPFIRKGAAIQDVLTPVGLMQVQSCFVLLCSPVEGKFIRHLVGHGENVSPCQTLYEVEVTVGDTYPSPNQ
jgi:hypothetical protein